jgi:cell division septation protein DedD
MKSSKRIHGAVACLLIIGAACGGGGDDRDPTVIQGNVVSASAGTAARPSQSPWRLALRFVRGEAIAQAPGVTVSVVNTDRSTETDEEGLFRFEVGQFGAHNLRFAGNGADATLVAILPFGGTYELADVEVEGNDVTVDEQRITFRGPITGIDCQQRLLQVLSGQRVPYRVRLATGTIIRDEEGETLSCPELSMGREAEVFSLVEELDTVIATEIQLNPSRVPTATPSPSASPTEEPDAQDDETATPTPTPTPTATETTQPD